MEHFSAYIPCILKASAHNYIYSLLYELCIHTLIHIRLDKVVSVHISNICSLCHTQPRLPGADQTAVFFVNHPNPAILLPVLFAESAASVCRAVVHQQDFQIGKSLT